MKTVLVLGGGIGGIRTARELSKKIGNEDGINLAKILVFEKEKKSLFAPSLTWMMVGKRETAQIQDDLTNTELGGIEVIFGEIESVDPENVSITSNGKTYNGDYMVVSLGAGQTDIHGLGDLGHNFYTVEGASSFYEDLKNFNGGRIAVVVSSLPHKSPVAPYEAAMLIDGYLREKGLRDRSEISLYTPEKRPMAFAGDEISDSVRRLMESKEILYHPEYELTSADENHLTFSTQESETMKAEFDLLAYTPKHIVPKVVQEAGLTGETGWVKVDSQNMQTAFENVYAIGDITTIPLSENNSLPKAGVFAQYQGNTVAHNIARKIHGKKPDKTFTAEGKYILEQGNGKASRVGGNFYSSQIDIKETSAIQHWVKILQEKTWFAKHF